MRTITDFLTAHGIGFERFEHPAVFTAEEAERLCPKMPGASVKNLFLRDKSGERHFLVVVGKKKRMDLNGLRSLLGLSKLTFGSEERMQSYLGVTPGAVTLLGLIHDPEHKVEVILDEDLQNQALQCHPLVNTATLVISAEGVRRFLEQTGHELRFLRVPERAV